MTRTLEQAVDDFFRNSPDILADDIDVEAEVRNFMADPTEFSEEEVRDAIQRFAAQRRAATTSLENLFGNASENRGCNWTPIWEACESPVFRVVDEEGNNVADGQIRHLQGRYWLYVDDTDGYQIMHENEAGALRVFEEHKP